MSKSKNEEFVDDFVNDSTENDWFISTIFDLAVMFISAGSFYFVYSYII